MNHRIELIPEEVILGQVTRKRLAAWAAVAGAVVVAVLLLAFSYQAKARAMDASVDPLRERVEAMENWELLLSPKALEFQAARLRRDVVRELLQEPSWSELLSDLAATSGDNLWVTQFSALKGSLADEEGAEREITLMTISGMTSSSSDLMAFMTAFSGSKHVAELGLEGSSAARGAGGEEMVGFEISGIVYP
jgi:Fimbrial assembly protein (PilN)